MGLLGAILVSSWKSWGHLGFKLGGLGGILAPTWAHLGSKLGVLEASWLQSEGSWGHLGFKLRGLGVILAPIWGVLEPSWESWRETLNFHGSWGGEELRQHGVWVVAGGFWARGERLQRGGNLTTWQHGSKETSNLGDLAAK